MILEKSAERNCDGRLFAATATKNWGAYVNKCEMPAVRLALKKMGRETPARPAQARALGWKEIKEFIGSAGQGLRADRERRMLFVAYETLARRGELVALEVRDIEFLSNGTGQALIRRGKTYESPNA